MEESASRGKLLCVDTSTPICSMALCDLSGEILANRISEQGANHSELVGKYAQELLEEVSEIGELVGGVVSEGPGSYTGLRIGASFAKGLCMSMSIPLMSVSTPEMLAELALEALGEDHEEWVLMPMIDARRMEVYTALYSHSLEEIHPIEALVLTDDEKRSEILQKADGRPLYYFGDGAAKAREVMKQAYPSAKLVEQVVADARGLVRRGIEKYQKGEFRDIAYWTPLYLKEYNAKISTNKVLGNARTE